VPELEDAGPDGGKSRHDDCRASNIQCARMSKSFKETFTSIKEVERTSTEHVNLPRERREKNQNFQSSFLRKMAERKKMFARDPVR